MHHAARRVYHLCETLYIIRNLLRYIIKPQGGSSPKGADEIQGRIAPLMIYAALRASMIYQACGLDEKIRILSNADFLAGAEGLEPTTPSFGDWCSTN